MRIAAQVFIYPYIDLEIGKNCCHKNQMIMGTMVTLLGAAWYEVSGLSEHYTARKQDLKVYCQDLSNIYLKVYRHDLSNIY